MTEVIVCITVGGVFLMLGIGFLYMVAKDLGIQEETRGFISLVDKVIAKLKRITGIQQKEVKQ